MAKAKLTGKQRQLVAELRHLLSTLTLDPDEIVDDADPEARTAYLELAKNQVIRSAVILKYVLMDEFLSGVICWHYFGRKRSFPRLWKTKRSGPSTTAGRRSEWRTTTRSGGAWQGRAPPLITALATGPERVFWKSDALIARRSKQQRNLGGMAVDEGVHRRYSALRFAAGL